MTVSINSSPVKLIVSLCFSSYFYKNQKHLLRMTVGDTCARIDMLSLRIDLQELDGLLSKQSANYPLQWHGWNHVPQLRLAEEYLKRHLIKQLWWGDWWKMLSATKLIQNDSNQWETQQQGSRMLAYPETFPDLSWTLQPFLILLQTLPQPLPKTFQNLPEPCGTFGRTFQSLELPQTRACQSRTEPFICLRCLVRVIIIIYIGWDPTD